ncbi:type I 3-dehydroquinate dehydratase [Agrilactobacillus yilanensis]|uniref:3-dehydroquinate dehydratase n=1 Tax=Agrilactobacillus yilanensis TaxID=2485997 RepID=A0ABW4J9A7_9LACO|nr:type I 3-dehydroquinate dehydratase [Agrilactobacillus yilanensis]
MIEKTGIEVRDITIGSGQPKIAVPITGKTQTEILSQAQDIIAADPDIVEWRIDFFEDVTNPDSLKTAAQALRKILKETALLTTFRTKGEGGVLALADDAYFNICKNVIENKFTDLIDVELMHDETAIKELITLSHEANVYVVMSNHDFEKTASQEILYGKLEQMADLNADIVKIAVMPQSVDDVLTLLFVTNEARKQLGMPVITMSMGDIGKISRISGEVFGSAVTFATVGAASAPGQIPIKNLRQDLSDLNLS